ncbi:arylsulfatase [Ktedonosporobacter rubrisoli]|nr:arylsulfatase [Ktedonosporobacter rubrisoli]
MTDPQHNGTFRGHTGRTWQDSEPWWPEPVRPPTGSPNVLFIVLDDTGFAHLGCYGSDISTPNIDSLAAEGLRYNNFHTTAICSPTRACLLSGRNHHATGVSFVTEVPNGFPNSRGKVSKQTGLLSEILKENGYNTIAVGKWHLVPSDEQSSSGPFDNWPLGRGFEHYYGFLGGETNQWNPDLVAYNQRIEQPRRAEEGYHLTEDLTDKAIDFVRNQQATAQGKPFFLYLAYGATHAPHQAPREFIDKYKGKYDKGWDQVREEWFARQKEQGIIPPETQLPPHNPGVKAWQELSPDEQRLFARMQEVFAGYLEHTDYHIGRLLDFLKEIGQFENTLIVFLSDNGASPEGGPDGTDNEWKFFNGVEVKARDIQHRIDDLGTPRAYNHYPQGWAQAGNTPLKWYKRWVHAGGVKDPLIIHYPAHIKDKGSIRQQYHHVTDITPTVLELIGLQPPASLNGVTQEPLHGTSLAYTFDQPAAPTRKQVQYYEMLGNRGIWQAGWKAVCYHQPDTPYEEDEWELYHVEEDFSESRDLATVHPEKLRQLIELWWVEAGRYNVLPLDDRLLTRGRAHLARRKFPTTYVFPPYIARLTATAGPILGNRSYTITAEIERADSRTEGVLVAQGGRFGGLALFIQNNQLVFDYNYLGDKHYIITSVAEVPGGASTLRFEFIRTGELQGQGRLVINGQVVGEGLIERTTLLAGGPGAFDVGQNTLTPVSETYETPFRFSGKLKYVTITLENAEPDLAAILATELATE